MVDAPYHNAWSDWDKNQSDSGIYCSECGYPEQTEEYADESGLHLNHWCANPECSMCEEE